MRITRLGPIIAKSKPNDIAFCPGFEIENSRNFIFFFEKRNCFDEVVPSNSNIYDFKKVVVEIKIENKYLLVSLIMTKIFG